MKAESTRRAWGGTVLALLLLLWHAYVAGTDGMVDGATLIEYGARKPNFGFPQAPWRLFASMFLHAGWIHVGVNALLVFLWGNQLCRLVGTAGFLATFLVTGLWGSLAGDIFGPEALAVGASGGTAGLVLAVLAMALVSPSLEGWEGQHRAWLQSSAAAVVLNVVMALGLGSVAGGRLDHWAHTGGALAGLLIGLVCLGDKREGRRFFWSGVGILSAAAAVVIYSRGTSPFG